MMLWIENPRVLPGPEGAGGGGGGGISWSSEENMAKSILDQ